MKHANNHITALNGAAVTMKTNGAPTTGFVANYTYYADAHQQVLKL